MTEPLDALHTQLRDLQAQLVERDQEIATQRDLIAAQQAMIAHLQAQLEQYVTRLGQLESQHQKDSRNSSKPPSSDGLRRRPRSLRPTGTKSSGGQPGHVGHTLSRVETPDVVVVHRPTQCRHCQHPLDGVPGSLVEERQVHDLPPPRAILVTSHQVEQICCPQCHGPTTGTFPAGIEPGVQYGPELRSYAVYLHHYQLLPMARTLEALADLCGVHLSEGILAQWVQRAAARVQPQVDRIHELVTKSHRMGGDETGIRVGQHLGWLHVASTRFLTYLAWHRQRGQHAMQAIGIWPAFHGQAMHDRWASYETFACQHRLCKAHLLRDLRFLVEVYDCSWAATLGDLLIAMQAATREWQARGVQRMPEEERTAWQLAYFTLIQHGFATLPPATPVPKAGKKGRPKQHPAKNLLDVLLRRADQIIGFVEDTSEDFTNNQREQDIRMIKVHEKIAGGFRSEVGATAFCTLRSYVATLRKQGHRAFAAIRSIFLDAPIPVAWGLE